MLLKCDMLQLQQLCAKVQKQVWFPRKILQKMCTWRFKFYSLSCLSVASLACGWTETFTTAGVTPVKHLGTPCCQKRRISMCRTQRSGLLNNKTVHHREKTSPAKGQKRSPPPQNNGNVPNLTAHHQGSPGWKLAIGCLLCVTTAVITELFFFVKNYLCVYLVTALCSLFAEQGGVCKAVKIMVKRR